MAAFSIHPHTTLGPVALTVSNLGRSLRFYRDVLGLHALPEGGDNVTVPLSTDGQRSLVLLTARPDARSKPPRTTGLYHYAILLPNRRDLARTLRRLLETRYPLQGASDHGVSEALYLADPDGNGIEIYRDRPRDEWPRRGDQLAMVTEPLDAKGVLGELEDAGKLQEPGRATESWGGLPAGTRIGHVHLHVGNLAVAETFYRQRLGFDLMQRYGPSAAFLSAGDYHHHVGINTWAGVGAPPPPPDAVGLRYFTIVLPDREELARVQDHLHMVEVAFDENDRGISLRDPSGNSIRLTVPGK